MTARTEEQRVRALHELQVLDTPREDRFDRVVRLAQRLFDVPAVAINLIDADRQWGKSMVGFTDTSCAREDAVCAHTIATPHALVVEDLSRDDRFVTNPAVAADDGLRFYAGHPLSAPGGERVGALCIVDSKPRHLSEPDLALLRDLADLVEKELAISAELTRAGEVQQLLLPAQPPHVAGYDIAGRCIPAAEVGGDFYDWCVHDDGRLEVTLADVMGKGIPSALVAASVRSMMRGAARYNNLPEAVNRAAHALEGDLDRTEKFVTLFIAHLDPSTGALRYVDAGHGLSVIVDTHGSHRRLVSDGLPLGALRDDTWAVHTEHLAPGETLISVSDGFLDLVPDLAEAIVRGIRASDDAPSAQALVDRFTAFADSRPTDDVTVVVVRRAPHPDPKDATSA